MSEGRKRHFKHVTAPTTNSEGVIYIFTWLYEINNALWKTVLIALQYGDFTKPFKSKWFIRCHHGLFSKAATDQVI